MAIIIIIMIISSSWYCL